MHRHCIMMASCFNSISNRLFTTNQDLALPPESKALANRPLRRGDSCPRLYSTYRAQLYHGHQEKKIARLIVSGSALTVMFSWSIRCPLHLLRARSGRFL